jgi:hypothetical protein
MGRNGGDGEEWGCIPTYPMLARCQGEALSSAFAVRRL